MSDSAIDTTDLVVDGRVVAAEVLVNMTSSGTTTVSFTTGPNITVMLPSSISIDTDTVVMRVFEGGATNSPASQVALQNLRFDTPANGIILNDTIDVDVTISNPGVSKYAKSIIGDLNKTFVSNVYTPVILSQNTHYHISYENLENKSGNMLFTLKFANLGT